MDKGVIQLLKGMFAPKEEMVSIDVIYEPDVKDTDGHWMSATTLEKVKNNFNENLEKGVVKSNLFHLQETDKFTIEKTWINEELDVTVDGSEEPIKAGTWLAKVKWHDPNLWELKKMGELGGFSLGGKGKVSEETGEIFDIDFSKNLGGDNE